MNQATYLGSRQVNAQKGMVTQSWSCAPNPAGNLLQQLPPFGQVAIIGQSVPLVANEWIGYDIDPQSVQSSFTFGSALSLQLHIDRYASFYFNAATNTQRGRVVIVIESSGEYYVFAPKRTLIYPLTWAPQAQSIESVNVVLSVPIGLGKIGVWLEPDLTVGNPAIPAVVVTLAVCNFDRAPVEAS